MSIALSHSSWTDFKICGFRWGELRNQPKSPDTRRGVTGISDHEVISHYLKGVGEISGGTFAGRLAALKEAGVRSEIKYAFTERWEPCEWFDTEVAFRMVLDAYYVEGETAHLYDFKTGKVKTEGWRDQLELNSLALFCTVPSLRVVACELWYLNHDHITRDRIHVWEVDELKFKWVNNLRRMRAAEEKLRVEGRLPRRPSGFCKVCKLHISNGGTCDGSPEPKA